MNNQNDFSKFAEWLSSLTANEFTLTATVTGFIIGQGLNYEQQNCLGNWLECVGQIVLTMSAQNQLLTPDDSDIRLRINNLEREIQNLKNKKL